MGSKYIERGAVPDVREAVILTVLPKLLVEESELLCDDEDVRLLDDSAERELG